MKINLIKILEKHIFILFFSILFFASISIFIAKSISNIYESKAILYASDDSRNTQNQSLISSFIPDASSSNAQFASKMLLSRDFFEILYRNNRFSSQLMAYESYDINFSNDQYDLSLYNPNNKEWITNKPPLELAHKVFLSKHFLFFETSDRGFFQIQVRHQSPIIAKEWNDLIIKEINKYVGLYKERTARQVLDYLLPLLASEKNAAIRLSIQNLITSNYQELALTKNEDYVFSIISKPYVPLKKSSPNRALICFAITFMGFIFTLFVIILKLIIRKN